MNRIVYQMHQLQKRCFLEPNPQHLPILPSPFKSKFRGHFFLLVKTHWKAGKTSKKWSHATIWLKFWNPSQLIKIRQDRDLRVSAVKRGSWHPFKKDFMTKCILVRRMSTSCFFYAWLAGRMSSQNHVLGTSNIIQSYSHQPWLMSTHSGPIFLGAPNSHLQELLILLSEKKRSADEEGRGRDTSNVRPQLFECGNPVKWGLKISSKG